MACSKAGGIGRQRLIERGRSWVGLATAAAAVTSCALAAFPGAAAARGDGTDCAKRHSDPGAAFGRTPCPGVRPGAPVHIETPVFGTPPAPQCTLGFMFRGMGERYMATAGHCVAASAEVTFAEGSGPVAFDGERRRIGEVVYSVSDPPVAAAEFDLALIRLDRRVKASPAMCHFDGPVGLNDDVIPLSVPPELIALHYYGNTIAGGYVPVANRWLLPARTGISTALPDARRVQFHGYASFVDSGAPVVTDDGRAVALIRGPGGADRSGYAGAVNALRLRHQIARAESKLGINLRLAIATAGSENERARSGRHAARGGGSPQPPARPSSRG